MPRSAPALRSELEGVKYLNAHPTVAQFFKQVGVFTYCEKLETFHHQIAEAFATTYDGRVAKVGREEFIFDEAAIHEATGLPRSGECWFKTTNHESIEFRSYLLEEHRGIIWNKSVKMVSLEPQWQALLRAIIVYVTCEGRYNRAMIYHFKLLNHFTGKTEINLPFYLHKALTKMSKKVKSEPDKLASRLSHHGLITLLVKHALQKRQIEWNHFLFWNGFSTEHDKQGKKLTPKSSIRKRRAVNLPPEEQSQPLPKRRRSRKKLDFDKDRTSSNPLNLPYSDSGSEAEPSAAGEGEQSCDLPTPTPPETTPPDKGKQPVDNEANPSPSMAGPSQEPLPPQDEKISQMFKDLHDARQAEKSLKAEKCELIGRNLAMYDIYQEMKEKFNKVLERNKMLMKDNVALYRKIRILRLQAKEAQVPAAQTSGLEALAEVAGAMEATAEHEAPPPTKKKENQAHRKKTPAPTAKKQRNIGSKKPSVPIDKKAKKKGATSPKTSPAIIRRSPRARP